MILTALNDVPLSPEAFRVYIHLSSLSTAGQDSQKQAWTFYQEVGDHCFPKIETKIARRNKAIRAVKELTNQNLIKSCGMAPDRDRYSRLDNSKWLTFSFEIGDVT